MRKTCVVGCVAWLSMMLLASSPLMRADSPSGTTAGAVPDFGKDIYPILLKSCVECHGPLKQESNLRLDNRESTLRSEIIQAGSPERSELWRRVTLPAGHEDIMPSVGQRLSSESLELLRRWITAGAQWPADYQPQRHWAYVAPQKSPLPPVKRSDWCRSPIDNFVLARLEQAGLAPSEAAEPEKLLRRVFLDLIGLPPRPDEVDAFVRNPTQDQLAQWIDDLLQRPQFGEKWARPWLDLARYADSHGFQRDNLHDLWAYRDWVIRALNEDMPFDRFTIEQLAGDLLPNASESQKIATGFHRCAATNVEAGSIPEETRVEQIIDRVNTTAAVWLGTTLECCQCHDHKYDPFTQREYYQFFAYFNNTQLEADRSNPASPSSIEFLGPKMAISDSQRDAARAQIEQKLIETKKRLADCEREFSTDLEAWSRDLVASQSQASEQHVLPVGAFQSQGPTDVFKLVDDGAILVEGSDPPDTDVYVIRTRMELRDVRGLRLEVLRHDSLPGGGPGRGHAVRRNFVLHDFAVEVHPAGSSGEPEAKWRQLKFESAEASFSQKNWDISGAIDTDRKSGWGISPQFDRDHWAVFRLSEPLDLAADQELVFKLSQELGSARTIGCFRLLALTGSAAGPAVPSDVLEIARQPVAAWTKKQRQRLLEYRMERDPASKQLTGQMAVEKQQLAQIAPDTTLVMVELEQPRLTRMFERGDYRNPGAPVEPATPAILHPTVAGLPNRLTLARWLVARENPLVARVTINRWWAELFGTGLVATAEDFGVKGELPSHPELLDWMAVDFMESGWSLKQWLKKVMLSGTYQQSSHVTPQLLERDDRNRLLARGPRLRMDAEMIRDNALSIAGLLDLKSFGEPIRPYQPQGIWNKVGGTAYTYEVSPGSEKYRRGLYVVFKRGSPYPSFINFDMANRLACTVRRSRSNTPLQALTLLNDPVYVEAAEGLAKRVGQSLPDATTDEQLEYAFQLCTARRPTAAEASTLKRLFDQQSAALRSREPNQSADMVAQQAWTAVSAVLLNLHETITKD